MLRCLTHLRNVLILSVISYMYPTQSQAFTSEEIDILRAELGEEAVSQLDKATNQVMSEDYKDRTQKDIEIDLSNPEAYAQRTDRMVELWTRYAAWVFERKGLRYLGDEIQWQYNQYYRGYMYRSMIYGMKDVGDHPPLSQWIADWYERLEDMLGQRTCELLHLDDIKIVNYTVPVVFQICGDKRFPPAPVVFWGADEYKLHFVPFGGVLGYWGTWGACTAMTFGAGVALACTPIAMLVEKAVVEFVAPPISDKLYSVWVPDKC